MSDREHAAGNGPGTGKVSDRGSGEGSGNNQRMIRPQFEDGFTGRTMLGILFVGLIMIPGSMYLGLVAGTSLGGAAEWVTIILFVELAKRSFTTLKKQEIYLLYYTAVALMMSEMGQAHGPLWNQYLIQSDAARDFGLAHQIPYWVSPPPGSEALTTRNLLHPDWYPYLALFAAGIIMSRVSWFSMAYFLFRVTSDVERLEFPLAPIAAEGATALAENVSGEETWRWRVFSVGAVIGLVFGLVYVGIPTFTSALTGTPLFLLPIPWVDMTQATETILPATAMGFTCNIGIIIVGMVLPFWVVIGTFAGALLTFFMNPILYYNGMLPSWHEGMDTIQIMFVNNVDFWLSFGMGTTFAVAVAGIISIIRQLRKTGFGKQGKVAEAPEGRGDFPLVWALGAYIVVTTGYIILSRMLVPDFPVSFFIFFGFIFTPINSYINARMVGLTGQFVGIPFVQEGTFILSGYKGVAIWFAPIPIGNYGAQAQKFKEMELTGTKFTSFLKAELFMIPVILVCSIAFWAFLWKLGPIPSPSYPYAQKMWRLQALNQSLWISGTASAGSWVAAEEGGVAVFERGEWGPPLGAEELEGLQIRDMVSPLVGQRYLATESGLYKYSNGVLSRFEGTAPLPSDDVRDLHVQDEQRVLVAMPNAAAIIDGTRVQLLEPPPAGGYERILVDADGAVLLQADGDIYRRTETGWESMAEELDLGGRAITDMVIDRAGLWWIGTDRGLFAFNGRSVEPVDALPADAPVLALTVDERDNKLAALPGALYVYDDSWHELPRPPDVGTIQEARLATAAEDLWYIADDVVYLQTKDEWQDLSTRENAPAGPFLAVDPAADQRWLLKAIKPKVVGAGFGTGLASIGLLTFFGLPVMLVYGLIRSMGSIPHMVMPEIIGALLGRYYFARKFGKENWARYTPVLAAGFACGMGLIGMIAVAVVLAAKSVISTPF